MLISHFSFLPLPSLKKQGKQKTKTDVVHTTSMSLLFNFVGFQFPAIIEQLVNGSEIL